MTPTLLVYLATKIEITHTKKDTQPRYQNIDIVISCLIDFGHSSATKYISVAI